MKKLLLFGLLAAAVAAGAFGLRPRIFMENSTAVLHFKAKSDWAKMFSSGKKLSPSANPEDGTLRTNREMGDSHPLDFGASGYVYYANFLDEIGYWREHDACAQKQGKLILQYLAGDRSVLPEIAALGDEINDMREALYCK